MNKTVTINISGLIFNIDEEAYGKLKAYLKNIEKNFSVSEGGDDIMADIEGRIAEMFSEKISDRKEVISMADVESMIAVMGQPEEFMDDETREENARRQQENNQSEADYSNYEESTEPEFDRGPKRFYRDPDEKILGGVCSGIGHYFGIDPIIIRLLFIIAFFAGFSGIPVYIILWIITPKATTRAEKLQMKGRKVNIDNIRESVKREAREVKKNFNNLEETVESYASGNSGRRIEEFFRSLFSFIGNIFKLLLLFVGKFLGIALFVVSILALISLTFSVIGFSTWDGIFSINGEPFDMSVGDLSHLMFGDGWLAYLLSIAIAITVAVPLVFMLLVGLKILFNNLQYGKIIGGGLMSLWVLGIILLIGSASFLAVDFSKSESEENVFAISPFVADTFNIRVNDNQIPVGSYQTNPNDFMNLIKIDDDEIQLANVKLNVVESPNDSIIISVIKKSRGNSFKDAQNRVEGMQYNYSVENNNLNFDPFFTFPEKHEYRGQQIKINVAIPIGKTVYLDQNAGWIIYDIKNYTNTHDSRMTGKYWTMTKNGLQCLHCNFEESPDYEINFSHDLNSMELRDLKKKLKTLEHELEIRMVKGEKVANRITLEFEKKMMKVQQEIEHESSEARLMELKLKLKEIESDLQIELSELELELDQQTEETKELIQEIKEIINNQIPDYEDEEIEDYDEEERFPELSVLTFPNPFLILN